MSDEPTPGELQRITQQIREDLKDGFGNINGRLDSMVSQQAFTAEMARMEDRIAEVGKDVADERAARIEADTRIEAALDKAVTEIKASLDRTGVWIRWVAASLLIPVALFVATWAMGRSR